MDSLINALFQMLSFGSIMVLVVLGLGVIASMMGIVNSWGRYAVRPASYGDASGICLRHARHATSC